MSEFKPPRIIFLDFDGVLLPRTSTQPRCAVVAPNHFPELAEPRCVDALNYITERTGAVIVVSSLWRKKGVPFCRETLSAWGVAARVMGVTPQLGTTEIRCECCIDPGERAREIARFLQEYAPDVDLNAAVDSFVILDHAIATTGGLGGLNSRRVRTNRYLGLSMTDAEQAISILGVPLRWSFSLPDHPDLVEHVNYAKTSVRGRSLEGFRFFHPAKEPTIPDCAGTPVRRENQRTEVTYYLRRDGSTGVFRGSTGTNDDSWFLTFVQHLESKGIDPSTCRFKLPDAREVKLFKTGKTWSWEISL